MKKLWTCALCAVVLVLVLAGLTACYAPTDATVYELSSEDFNPVVEYGGVIDYSGLILYANLGTTTSEIEVTPDLVISGGATDTVGKHSLTIHYRGTSYTVDYEVKYKVQFAADGDVISTQYVLRAEELTVPDAPAKSGYVFTGWSPVVDEELTDNVLFVAQYAQSEVEPPALSDLTATYGDTLADIALPENGAGKWQFVADPSTPVGNVGRHTFPVTFVPSDPSLDPVSASLTVRVVAKAVTFEDVTVDFVWDGEEHFPTYTLSEDVAVRAVGSAASGVGTYDFMLLVTDPNYTGEYEGSFTIAPRAVTVNITLDGESTIPYGTPVPTVGYTLEGFDNAELLGLTLEYPTTPSVGVYTLTATVENPNVELTVNSLTLTVVKADPTPAEPTVTSRVVFGDTLGMQTFSEDSLGRWEFVDEGAIIDTPKSFTAEIRFVPFDTKNYNEITGKSVTFAVEKRSVTIELVGSTSFVYDGKEHALSYTVRDGEQVLDVRVDGVPTGTNAGSYTSTLSVQDDRYTATLAAILTIGKATPEVHFDALSFEVVWSEDLTLGDLKFPEGYERYAFDHGTTALSAVGEFSFAVTYTPEDTANYSSVTDTVPVKVSKAPARIDNLKESYSFPYVGGAYTLSGVIPSHGESGLTVSYEKDGKPVDALIHAGEYTVTVTLPESEHYLAASATTTFIITKIDAEGERPTATMRATFEDTLADLPLPENEHGTWSWQDGTDASVGSVGTHTFLAVFTPDSENYNALTVTVSVIVEKKKLSVEILDSSFVYDGAEKTLLYRVTDGERDYTLTVRVTGNVVRTDAGSYAADLVIDDASYEGSSGVTTLVIAKAPSVPTLPEDLVATYGDVLSGVALPEDAMGSWTWDTPDATVGAAGVQTHTATFVPNDTKNYELYTEAFAITVVKRGVVIPTIDNNNATYNGKVIVPAIATGLYTVDEAATLGYTNAGDYDVTLTLTDPDNYEWIGTEGAAVTLAFTVKKAQATLSGVSVGGWIFGASAPQHTASTNSTATIGYAYYDAQGALLESKPTDAGEYTLVLTVAECDNYLGTVAEYAFTVERKSVTRPTVADTVYNDKAVELGFKTNDAYTVEVTKDGDAVGEIKNAGAYTVALYLDKNYKWSDGTEGDVVYTLTVERASATLTDLTADGWTFGATAPTHSASVNLSFVTPVYTYYAADGTTLPSKPTDAGSYRLVVSVADSENVVGASVEASFTVAPQTVPTPEITNSGVIYTGALILPELVTDSRFDVNAEALVGYVGAGSYTVTLTLVSDNYVWSTGDSDGDGKLELTFSIAKAEGKLYDVSVGGWTFGATSPLHTASTNSTAGIVFAYYGADGTLLTGKPTDAGKYTLVLTLPECDNYLGTVAEYSFTVEKKAVTLPTVGDTTYNGQAVELGFKTGDAYTVEVTKDGEAVNEIKNAGAYTVALYLDKNYKWSDGTDADVTYTLTVAKAQATLTGVSVVGWTFGATVPQHTATTNSTAAIGYAYYDAQGTLLADKPTDAGEYTLVLTVPECDNYLGTTLTRTFTVAKKTVTLPTVGDTTYNGQAVELGFKTGDAYTVEVTLNGEEITEIRNAGVYTVALYLDKNYKWSDGTDSDVTYTLTVAKAQATLTGVSVGGWTWGSVAPLHTASTNSTAAIGYAYYDAQGTLLESKPTDAGEYTLVLTVPECDNYLGTTLTRTFTVAKKTVEIPTVTNKVYNGQPQRADLSDTDDYTVTKNEYQTEAAGYEIILTLRDASNTKWSDGSEAASTYLTFYITQKLNEWTTEPTVQGWTYGDTPVAAFAEALFGEVVIEYKSLLSDVWTSVLPTDAGEYAVRFTVISDEDYSGLEKTLTFTIAKQGVAPPTAIPNSGAIYDGSVILPEIPVSALYTVSHDEIRNAGDYTVSVTLSDSKNYYWSGIDGATVTLSFTVAKAQATLTGVSVGGWTFGDEAPEHTATTNSTAAIGYAYYNADGELLLAKPTDAGEYTLVLTVPECDNYLGTVAEYSFTVEKQAVTLPTVSDTTYNGQAVELGFKTNDAYTVEVTLNGEEISEIKNAGAYTVALYLDKNYKWSDGTDSDVTYTLTVNKATATLTGVGADGWTYGDEAPSHGATASFGTATYAYYDQSGALLLGKPTDAGTYTLVIRVADSENWYGLVEEYEFTVARRKTSAPTLDAAVYDGSDKTPAISSDAYTVTFLDASGNPVNTITAAGNYTVSLRLDDNYCWQDGSVAPLVLTFTVARAKNVISGLTLGGWIYGDAAGTPTVERVFDGVVVTFTYYTADGTPLSGVPTEAGDYLVGATAKESTNWESTTLAPISFTVARRAVALPALPDATYTGESIPLGFEDDPYYTVLVDGESDFSIVGAGDYTVTLTLTSNYRFDTTDERSVTRTLTVGRAQAVISDFAMPSFVFGEYDGTLHLPTAKTNFGEVTFTFATSEDGTYGTTVFTDAGTYFVRATVNATENYEGASATISYTVERATAPNPGALTSSSVVYTGSAIELLTENGLDATYYEIPTITEVGSHTVLLTVRENYKWSDALDPDGDGVISLGTLTVVPALADFESVTIATGTWAYGSFPEGNTVSYLLTLADGTTTQDLSLVTVTVVNIATGESYALSDMPTLGAGEYRIVLTLNDEVHYTDRESYDSENGTGIDCRFTVTKREVALPTLPSVVYDGKEHSSALSDTADYTVTGVTATDVGKYEVTLTLTDSANTVFATDTDGDGVVTVIFEITKASNAITGLTVNSPEYGTAITPSATATFGSVSFVYSTTLGGEYVATVPTVVGTYYVKAIVPGTANYDGAESTPVAFSITRKTVTLPAIPDVEADKDGKTVKPVVKEDGFTVVSNVGGSTVGTYTVTLALYDDTNYKWSNGSTEREITISYEIFPIVIEFVGTPTISTSHPYDGKPVVGTATAATASGVSVPVIVEYRLQSATDADYATTAPTAVGKYFVRFRVESTTAYDGIESVLAFEITKGTPAVTFAAFTGNYYENFDFLAYLKANSKAPFAGTYTFAFGDYTFSGASAVAVNATLTFTPDAANSANYKSASTTVAINLLPAAYIGTTYYGTVEKALAASVSGDVVWVLPTLSGLIIKESCEIPAGVTLLLPHTDGTRNASGAATGSGAVSAPAITTLSSVTLAEGKTLTVLGTLEISGELHGGNGGSQYSGHTHGNCAELVLGSGAKVENYGLISAYGFLRESTKNNGSEVNNYSGATLSQPFVLRDHIGGTNFSSIYDKGKGKTTMFKRFFFMNVEPTTTYAYGSQMTAYANLYANGSQNSTTAYMIGYDTTSVLQMTDEENGSIVSKYDKDGETMKLDFYGGCTMNGMLLEVAGMEVDTTDYLFPISYHYDITLNATQTQKDEGKTASYNMPADYMMLPGAKLTVEEGCELTIGQINILDSSYKDACQTLPYPTTNSKTGQTLASALLTVHGKLIATSVGGTVYADSLEQAKEITNKVYSSQDLLKGALFGGDFQPAVSQQAVIKCGDITYIAVNGEFIDETQKSGVTVTYNTDGGSTTPDAVTVEAGTTITLPAAPSKSGYSFEHWSDGTSTYDPGASYTVNADVTITAIWKKNSICVAPDTLVTLADGTKKEIQYVSVGDEILAWNFYTGRYEIVPVTLLQAHYTGYQNVLHLYFEDGSVLKVLGEHGIFDAQLNTFIFIDEGDVENYLGHSFVKKDGDTFTTVRLVGYEVTTEYTTAYTILSLDHYNAILEDMLTVTPAHVGANFFNPFEIGEDMKYDEAAVEADIEKYGLYTYEDFAHVLSEEQFNYLNLGHFKVSVGKGLVTYEGLIYLIETFINGDF